LMHIPAEAIVGFPVIPGEKGNFMVGRVVSELTPP
jgi:hypothetical protein